MEACTTLLNRKKLFCAFQNISLGYNEHLITDDSSKHGKPPNAHKHKKHGYQQFKDKMVTQVVAKADVLKGTEKFFLFISVVHTSMKKRHYVHLQQDTGKISCASCTCTAGKVVAVNM